MSLARLAARRGIVLFGLGLTLGGCMAMQQAICDAGGCHHWDWIVARSAAEDLACAPQSLRFTEVDYGFRADGCGKVAYYRCWNPTPSRHGVGGEAACCHRVTPAELESFFWAARHVNRDVCLYGDDWNVTVWEAKEVCE